MKIISFFEWIEVETEILKQVQDDSIKVVVFAGNNHLPQVLASDERKSPETVILNLFQDPKNGSI